MGVFSPFAVRIEASFVVRAGRGGDGSVSFNREKYKPRGGPDGGRGGDGGKVILQSTQDLPTLELYAHRKVVKAGPRISWSTNDRAGDRGKDAVVDVPVGTQVFDGDGLLADLYKRERFVVAGGGRAGAATAPLPPRPARRRHSGRGDCPARSGRSVWSSSSSLTSGSSVCRTQASLPAASPQRRPAQGRRISIHYFHPSSGSWTRGPIANGSSWQIFPASSPGPARARA